MEVYTLGRTTNYDASLAGPIAVHKIGFRSPDSEFPEGYGGGWIWKYSADADAFRRSQLNVLHPAYDPETFSIYVVEINDWESDVSAYPDEIDGVYRLLEDRPIIRKL